MTGALRSERFLVALLHSIARMELTEFIQRIRQNLKIMDNGADEHFSNQSSDPAVAKARLRKEIRTPAHSIIPMAVRGIAKVFQRPAMRSWSARHKTPMK
jgi:hypothetical protein